VLRGNVFTIYTAHTSGMPLIAAADSGTYCKPALPQQNGKHLSTVVGWSDTSYSWIEFDDKGGIARKVYCKWCRRKSELVRASTKAIGSTDVTSFCKQ
jgi:hypothetical protein